MPYMTSKLFRILGAVCILLAAVFLVLPIEPLLPKVYAVAFADSRQSAVYQTLISGQKVVPQQHVYEKPNRPTVYLTFDDGPSAHTPEVLDILRKENIKATFFVVGSMAQSQPKLIKRILEEGHSLGNHTFNHVYKQIYSSFAEYWRQIQQSEAVLNQITGVRPTLLRAPGGTYTNFDPFYFYYLEQAGYQVFDWNIDSGDSKRRNVPASEIVNTVKRGRFPNEMTVLMHDGAGHGQTVKALPEIIRIFKEKGYSFAPLTERVKPITFSVGKVKWHRSFTTESFYNQTMEMVNKYVAERQGKPNDSGQQEPGDHIPPLTVVMKNKGKLTFDAAQYELRKGRFYVPLKQLMEQMGGRVLWSSSRRTVSVTYGSSAVEYDWLAKTMKVLTPEQTDNRSFMSEMEVQQGIMMVPLRFTVELFNNEITYYSLSSDQNEVEIAPKNSFGSFLAVGRFKPDAFYAAAAYADEAARRQRAFAMGA